MKRRSRGALASALVVVVLAAPGGALASTQPMDAVADQPVHSSPAVLPTPEGPETGLVAPKLSRDQAIAMAKEHFEIPAALGAPNVGINQDQERAIWSLSWQSPSKQAERIYISAGVDAVSGAVLYYSFSSSQMEESTQLAFTRAEAKANAAKWFERLVPAEQRGQFKAVEIPFNANYWGGATYQFQWELEVDGYPMRDLGVYIIIDARSGALREFNQTVRSVKAPVKPDHVLTQAEAEARYAEQLGLELQYQRINKPWTEESEWRLVYRPVLEFPSMDQDGKLLDSSGRPLDLATIREVKLVPASERPYQKPAAPLDQRAALAVAQAVSGRQDAPKSTSYSEYGEETKRSAWDFLWTPDAQEGKRPSELRVRVDAETGLLTEFSNWTETKPFDRGEKPPVSEEQARDKAMEFLRTHRPDLAGSMRSVINRQDWEWRDPDYQSTEYYLSFEYLQNGIPTTGRSISVSVNARTGAVINFWASEFEEWGSFPAADGVISAEAAMQSFLKHQGIAVGWASFWQHRTGTQTDLQLVWQPNWRIGTQGIDALSGAPIDWQGRDLIEAQRYPEDIQGHAAEREIELLWNRGVLDLRDGKFLPDQAVAADDLVRWIVLSGGMRPFREYDFALNLRGAGASIAKQAAESPNSAYYGAALQAGIVTPEDLALIKDLDGPVPRELFALWSARAMGYGRIAKMEAKIEMGFADQAQIGARYRNAVALLAGLSVVTPDAEGRFEPQRSLTRAEAARILFAVTAR